MTSSEYLLPAPVEAVYDELCGAILRGEEAEVAAHTRELCELLVALGSGGSEAAEILADDLLEGWLTLDEDPDNGEQQVDQSRSLLLDVLVHLGDSFPAPVFAGAYEYRGLELVDTDPQAAARHMRRAVALAETDQERAGYLLSLVLAVAQAGDLEQAVSLAEDARRLATDPGTQDMADAMRLELLCDLGDARAGAYALGLLDRRHDGSPDEWGAAVMRALIGEAARLEAEDLPASPEVAAGLRTGLGRLGWLPEPLTSGDFATLVAWVDFSRDDLSQLEPTMAGATAPFSDVDIEARAALLRVMVALGRLDVPDMEVQLRAAAPAVARSGAKETVTAYRLMSELVNAARNGRPLADLTSEFDGVQRFQGREPGPEVSLFHQAMGAFTRVWAGVDRELPAAVQVRLDAWCLQPQPGGDPLLSAALWAYGAASAMFSGDFAAARLRIAEVRRARALHPSDSPQGRWLDMFVNGLAPSLDSAGEPIATAAAIREVAAGYRRSGNRFGAFVADAQLAILLVERNPAEALASAVRALEFRAEHGSALAGSSERTALRESEQELVSCALRAAARLQDPRLMAELLEFLRAQEMPAVPTGSDTHRMPLAVLLPPAAFGEHRGRSTSASNLVDAVGLPQARRVRMPWGTLALAGLLPPTPGVGSVELIVPVLGSGILDAV